MFYVNKEVDYALQLLTALHRLPVDNVLSLKQFSNESTISFLFLQKIARKLKKAKVVSATKGSKGGYILVRDLNDFKLLELVEIICGPYGVAKCVTEGKTCDKENVCLIKPGIEKMNCEITKYMSGTKISEMVDSKILNL